MKKSELKLLIREVVEELQRLPKIVADIDNNVFPLSSDDLEELIKPYHVTARYLGDAAFGTETLARYRIILAGPQGQLDSLVDRLAQENGIEFMDDIQEVAPSQETKELVWKDGVKVTLDQKGEPVGYKNLGWANDATFKQPATKDWRRFYVGPSGKVDKYLSPSLKVWYAVDSSG